MKACSLINVDEVMKLAGVAALTLPPTLLQALKETEDSTTRVADLSMFDGKIEIKTQVVEHSTFMDDEANFRAAFSKRDDGKAKVKTEQVRRIRPKVNM